MKALAGQKLFKAGPFAPLDHDGVGRLIRQAVQLGRPWRSDLEVGICGEPSSVEFCYRWA